MAYQLVYTSAAKLLDAGRSGFGTVARAKAISPLLVSAIERVSQFANLRGNDRSRVIFVHRRIIAANNRVHVLSRICDSGADYTGRTNHIAHHLVISQEEVARAATRGLTPADVLGQFPWLGSWEGSARFFSASEDVPLEQFQPLGRQSARAQWARITGNPAHARILAWEGAPRTGVLMIPRGVNALGLLAEALYEFGAQSWSRSFTTSLETTDELSDLDWIVASPENFSEIQGRCGSRGMLDVSQPHSLPLPPEPVQKTPEPELQAMVSPVISSAHNQNPVASRTAITPVVNSHIRDGSSGAGPKRGSAPFSGKPRMNLVLWVGVLVIVLALAGVATWKAVDPKEAEKIAASGVKLTNPQEQAVRDMKAAGISKDDARKVAEKALDQAPAWAMFSTGFLKNVQGIKSFEDLQNLPKPPGDGEFAGAPEWLGFLVAARNAIPTVIGEEKELKQRLEGLSVFIVSLESAGRDLNSNGLTTEICSELDKSLTTESLGKIFSPGSLVKSEDKGFEQLHNAIERGQLSVSKNPPRYEVLGGFIAEHFEDFAANQTSNVIAHLGGAVKSEDEKGFELALYYWTHPEKQPTEEELKQILASNFVPKDFKMRREKHKSASSSVAAATGEAAKPEGKKPEAGPDLSGLKDKAVIVVTRDELRKGVEVDVLKTLLSVVAGDKLLNEGLEILVDGKKINNLSKVTGQEYFSENYLEKPDDSNVKIYSNGKISLNLPEVNTITVTYNQGKTVKKSQIAIDDKNAPAFEANLSFAVSSIENNSATLIGDLAQALKNTLPEGKELKVRSNLEKEINFTIKNAEVLISKIPTGPARMHFHENDFEKINQSFLKFKDADTIPKNGNATKNAIERNKEKDARLEWIKSVNMAIGGAMILEDPSLKGEKTINVGNIKMANNVARKLGYAWNLKDYPAIENKKSDENGKKTENGKTPEQIHQEIDEENIMGMKKGVGEKNEETFFQNHIKEKVDLNALQTLDGIEKLMTKLRQYAKPPEPENYFEQIISKLDVVEIQTSSGRVLFKATKSK